jgi:ribosomal protein S18 acetylase RimI-like enzyme
MRLLYVKDAECEHDQRIVRQLARLSTDRKVTTVKRSTAAPTVLRKAPDNKRFHALVTSPALDEAALVQMVRDIILNGGPLATLVPVVLDEPQSRRAFKAGADAVLTFRDGGLVSPELAFRVLEEKFPKPGRTAHDATLATTPVSQGARVLRELWRFGKYLSKSEPAAAPEPLDVEVVRRVDEDLVEAAARLVPQLSPSTPRVPDAWELEQIIRAPGTTLLVAREGHTIVGMLTLHTFRAATGIHAWIQDLIVDSCAKGRGVSELLTKEAMRHATEQGARTAELTSRPSHAGTGRLYERLGFERRETHLYRFQLLSS